MSTFSSGPLLTADDLLAAAARHHLHATQRLISDWVGLGLIDQAYHRGRGQGLGSRKGTWSKKQAELFVDLLWLRQRPEHPVKSVIALTTVPVCAWLWSGEASDVPLRQVKRALWTWCGRTRSRKQTPAGRARKIAREIVKQVDNPEASASDRRALRELIELGVREQTFDPEQVRDAVERVFDAGKPKREIGPREAPLTAAGYVRLLEAQAKAFLHLGTFTDEEYEDARIIYRQSRRGYVESQPRLAADPQRGSMVFEEPTFPNVLYSACQDLLLVLGMGRLAPDRRAQIVTEAGQAVSS